LVDNSGLLVERIYVCLNGYQPTSLPYRILVFHSWPFSISLLACRYHLKYFILFILLNFICSNYLIDRRIRQGLDRYRYIVYQHMYHNISNKIIYLHFHSIWFYSQIVLLDPEHHNTQVTDITVYIYNHLSHNIIYIYTHTHTHTRISFTLRQSEQRLSFKVIVPEILFSIITKSEIKGCTQHSFFLDRNSNPYFRRVKANLRRQDNLIAFAKCV